MAASSKPTGVHYALIGFVLLSITLGVCLLLAYKGSGSIGELRAETKKAKDDAATWRNAADKTTDQMNAIRALVGSKNELGDSNDTPNTLRNELLLHIKQHGAGLANPTVNDLITKMSEEIRSLTVERNQLKDALGTELTAFQQKIDELNSQLSAEKDAKAKTDKHVVDADNIHKEEIGKRDADIESQRKAIGELNDQVAQLTTAMENAIKTRDQRISSLLTINKKLTTELDAKTRPSFEVADGQITFVDNLARKVWIDLGEVDGLRPRTTFSVYKKDHYGVGRASQKNTVGPEDIKASIEVTKILGPHSAEARILPGDDIYNPIGKADPIYSPIWSSGRGETFSIVGIMDLDGDGKSDRDLLKELVRTVGGSIDNEVTDEGDLYINGKLADEPKPKITEKTKFLVIGKIPDLAEATVDDAKTIQKILDLQKELDQQARERGVRVVSLSDFLAFMGYKSQRRLFTPGGESDYKLNAGAKSRSVDEKVQPRGTSTGHTSGSVSGDKAITKPKTAPGGNTSGAYKRR